jgi:hypothetical protein
MRTEASKMWLMLTDMKHTTVRKVRHNLSKSSFFKLFAKFADLSKSWLSPGTEIGQQGSKIGGKKTKKPPILFTFRKVVFFFWPFPRKMGREVGGNGWGYCSGGLGAAGARRVWPCRPCSALQNGIIWQPSDAIRENKSR